VARRTFFGNLRLAILLAILLAVALNAWLDRRHSTDWDATLRVTVYPIALTEVADVHRYVAGLDGTSFEEAVAFIAREAERHDVPLEEPVRIRISRAATSLPPAAPADPGPLSVAAWSLRFRYWAWRVASKDPLPTPDVQVFALYHAEQDGTALPDSLGLSKGLMAVTHLFAAPDATSSNQVVLVHELLHTLGATDKYDLSTGQPLVPDGLGDPAQEPLFPQATGEIMAGRIAIAPDTAEIPGSLEQMVVGPATAREIGWPR
jgi:hypothetical protein